MVQKANAHRRELQLEVGDRVLMKLQPFRQTSVVNRPFRKLAMWYFGPFTVLERIGAVAYRLELLERSRIHPIFHISLLKPCKGSEVVEPVLIPLDNVGSHPIVQPVAICALRTILRQGHIIP